MSLLEKIEAHESYAFWFLFIPRNPCNYNPNSDSKGLHYHTAWFFKLQVTTYTKVVLKIHFKYLCTILNVTILVIFSLIASGKCSCSQQNLLLAFQDCTGHFLTYCRCTEVVKLCGLLLSPYRLTGTCMGVTWLRKAGNQLYIREYMKLF
jgi:hypothetical protein